MALQESTSNAGLSALQQQLTAGAAPVANLSGRPHLVLDEDEYTEKLERIIERDFFPDVPKLQNKLEWLQAVNSGDPTAIRNAQMNIAARRSGVPTPLGATPAQFATPAGGFGGFGTPGSLVRPSSALRTPQRAPQMTPGAAATAAGPPFEQQQQQQQQQRSAASGEPSEGLNSFLSKHTSEDNASFSEIMEEGRKRAREKNAWLYQDKNAPPMLLEGASRGSALALEGGEGEREGEEGEEEQQREAKRAAVATDGFGSGNAPDGALVGWKHTPKNQLYYHKDSAAFSTREKAERAMMSTKKILHSNTRLPSLSSSSTGLFSPEGGSRAATPTPSGAGGEGNGYSAVATPSMTPGADGMSPLMTWGDIESTPLRIDAEDYVEAGPSFRIPEVPTRDLLVRKLAASTPSTGAKHRLSSASRAAAASPLSVLRRGYGGAGASGTPGAAGAGASASRGGRVSTPLSAAGKRLVSQIHGRGGASPAARQRTGGDLGLRASYAQSGSLQHTPSGTPVRSAHKPPSSASRRQAPKAPPLPPGAAKASKTAAGGEDGKAPKRQKQQQEKKEAPAAPGKDTAAAAAAGGAPASANGRSLTDGLLKI